MTRNALLMSILVYCVVAATVSSSATANSSRGAAEPATVVSELLFSRAIASRRPVGEGRRWKADGQPIYGFVELNNGGAPCEVTMEWSRAGSVRFRYKLNVGRSKSWRTWSRLRATRAMVGKWTVTVRGPSGRPLASREMQIVRPTK